MAKNMNIDYDKYLNKAFLVDTFKWESTQAVGTVVGSYTFPDAALVSNFLKVPFINSSLFRCRAKAIIQVIGTPQHQGILLASAEPVTTKKVGLQYINNSMNAPHSFLIANTSTCTELELPFYSNTKLLRTDSEPADILFNSNYSGNQFCTLNIQVLNPLVAAESGSTTITGTVHVIFEELEFYAPFAEVDWVSQSGWEAQSKVTGSLWSRFCGILTTALDNAAIGAKRITGDFIDLGRAGIRQYTGLHNANKANIEDRRLVVSRNPPNIVDHQNVLEKLDPYVGYNRIIRDTIFDTTQDEMDVLRLVSKPQYLSTFAVDVDTQSKTLLFSRPITPTQQVYSDGQNLYLNANQQVMAYFSRYWSGTIKVHIQADMTNFHNCKLAVFKAYSPHRQMLTSYPEYSTVQGLLVDFLEFSSGGQVQTIELPFCSQTQNLECTRDWAYNILQHGMYYIYLAQPLVTNGTVSKSVNFNVYYSMGDDACFYGYSTDNAESIFSSSSKLEQLELTLGTDKLNAMISDHKMLAENFVAQSDTVFPVNGDEELTEAPKERHDYSVDCETHRPITNLRDIIRRVVPVFNYEYSSEEFITKEGVFVYPISDLLGITQDPQSSSYYGNVSSLLAIRRLFLGMDGGIKAKIKIQGSHNAYVTYIPPGTNVSPEATTKIAYASSPLGVSVPFTDLVNYSRQYEMPGKSIRQSSNRQEAANYTVVDSRLRFNTLGEKQAVLRDECIFDVEIPNMNPCRFTGTSSIYDPREKVIDMCNDLGTLVVSVKRFSNTDDTSRKYIVSIDMGFTDETRLGYQVRSAELKYPVLDVEDGYLVSDYYHQYSGTKYTAPAKDPQSVFKYAYFG
jgi:hypothetical protein